MASKSHLAHCITFSIPPYPSLCPPIPPYPTLSHPSLPLLLLYVYIICIYIYHYALCNMSPYPPFQPSAVMLQNCSRCHSCQHRGMCVRGTGCALMGPWGLTTTTARVGDGQWLSNSEILTPLEPLPHTDRQGSNREGFGCQSFEPAALT